MPLETYSDMDQADSLGTNHGIIEMNIDFDGGHLQEGHSCSTISDFDGDCVESSIKEQVESLEALFASQDLDMAISDIETLQGELKRNQDDLRATREHLLEREDDLARLKLERDLATAEKNLLKQQLSLISEDCHVSFQQFVPYSDPCGDIIKQKFEFDEDLSDRLLGCLKDQEKLHERILKTLHGEIEGSSLHRTRERIRRRTIPKFLTLIFRSKAKGGGSTKKKRWTVKLFFGRKNKNPGMKYYAIHDNGSITDDEESVLHVTSPICYKRKSKDEENSLFDEMLKFRQNNENCIQDASEIISLQAKKISSLQNELDKYMDILITDCPSTQSEDDPSIRSCDTSSIFSTSDNSV